MFRNLVAFIVLSILTSKCVVAHPGEEHDVVSFVERTRRQVATNTRHLLARKCSSTLAKYEAERKAKRRYLKKRQATSIDFTTSTLSASAPTISTIQNFTCITAPDVTEGPYYINNEYIRQDLREDQAGIALELDIGVLNTATCEPMTGVFVELWHANTTGKYGGFTALGAVGTGEGGVPPSGSGSMGPAPTDTLSGSIPSGTPGGGGTPPSTTLTDNSTWLRGGYPTNSDGMVGLTTIYPGFYAGRTVHIHTMVHYNWTAALNGTIISHAGQVMHVGQFFFDESWNDMVMNTTTYLANTNPRTYNADDSIFAQENSGGNSAYVSLEMVGETLEDGLLGYVTMGINPNDMLSIDSTNYNIA